MAAEYEIIAAQLLRVNSRNHAAWNEWGRGIFNEALKMPPDIAEPMLADAGRKFTVASDLSPNNAVYWQNRGAALLERAKRDTTGTPLPLLEEASEYYERAIRLSTRQFEAWKGAALCFMERAMRSEASACEILYDASFVRFAVLAELSPANHEAWHYWGHALLNCAQKIQGDRSLPLLMESLEKSDRAVALQPGDFGPLNNAALALLNLADRIPDSPAAPRWLAEADAKLRQGLSFAPDAALLWANRGLVLLTQSRRAARSERKELLSEADALYLVANRLDPDSHQTLLNWGNVRLDLGIIATTDADAVAHYAEADAKFRSSIEKEPGVALYWTNWGILYSLWAVDGDPRKSLERCLEASEKFAVANNLNADAFNNSHAWADMLCFQAKFATDSEQFEALLNDAESKCNRAFDRKPDSYQPYLIRGNIYLRKASCAADHDKCESLLTQALHNYRQANEIDLSKGVYDMACVAAKRNMPEECRRLLEDGLERDSLPLRRRIVRDDDMLAVRDEEWFRQLLERLPR